ncbi:MAG TPA: hypothetical protein VFW94_01855, partial [Candidatus Acidoferrales bacterium]|nr:hypothetical protein [Candidatus Acidoferrales bacterium]
MSAASNHRLDPAAIDAAFGYTYQKKVKAEVEDPYPEVPVELKALRNWVNYQLVPKTNKDGSPSLKADGTQRMDKIPYNPAYPFARRRKAESDNPQTWGTYEQAVANVASGFSGIGFEFGTEDKKSGFVGGDLDGCVANGEIAPWAKQILAEVNSYSEQSQSETGAHFITRGVVPSAAKIGSAELYDCERFFVFTGKRLAEYPAEVRAYDCSTLHARIKAHEFDFKHKDKSSQSSAALSSSRVIYSPKGLTSEQKIELFMLGEITSENRPFVARYEERSVEAESQSEVDLSLVNLLVAKHQGDTDKADEDFRTSILMRDKWDRTDYRGSTLKCALESYEKRHARSCDVPPSAEPPCEEPYQDLEAALRPKLEDAALYGLAGDIVRTLEPQTEAHPAGLLGQILLYYGNVIGRTAYHQINSTRHYGNIFVVRCGKSSKARKGTAGDIIDELYEQVDPVWFRTRVRSGMSSAEGLVVAVGDEELSEKDGTPVVVHPEVRDKRLVSHEGEFAQVLVVMQRPTNPISVHIRNAWDGKPLRTLTIKPRTATNHTVSILGDITITELKKKMTEDDSMNGFANRFLWVHVERTKLLPFGGEDIDFAPFVERLRKSVEFAQSQGRIYMDENAKKMWGRVYKKLSAEHEGLFGSVTSRGEAQVIRLALLYALLDCSDCIRSEHLRAALAFWQYCEDSARFIFDALTSEQRMIVEFLMERGSQTKTA